MDTFSSKFVSQPVSRLGLGCEQLGGVDWGDYDYRDGMNAVTSAVEKGINLFDTANVYGLGLSEERLSEALGAKRHDMCIVTKGGFRWDSEGGDTRAKTRLDLSPENMVNSIEGSLRRLRLDTLPLYLVHWPAPDMDLEALVTTLAEARESGRIAGFGLSNFSLAQIEKACSITSVDAVEIEYNLLVAENARNILEFARSTEIITLAYGALAQGLLTGKYDHESVFPSSDRRHRLPQFNAENLPYNLTVVERVKQVAEELNLLPAQVATRWCLDSASLDAAVVGVKNMRQLDELIDVGGLQLSTEQLDYLSCDEKSQAI